MKVSSLHKKIKSIYKNQLSNHEKSNLNNHLKYKEDKFLEKLNSLVSDYKLTAEEASKYPEFNDILTKASAFAEDLTKTSERTPTVETMTPSEYRNKSGESVEEYRSAVKAFSDNGGTGFYDIGVNATFQLEYYQELFEEGIEKAVDKGLDIQILEIDGRHLENPHPTTTDYRGSVLFVMPSSQLEQFHDILREMNSELVDVDAGRLSPSYDTDFITPYFREHEQVSIEQAKEYLETTDKERSHRKANAITLLGISRSEISSSIFPGSIAGNNHLSYAMERAFHHIDLYSLPYNKGAGGRREHVNGLMPNIFVYNEDEMEKLGVEQGKLLDISIPNEIKLHDMELELKKDHGLAK